MATPHKGEHTKGETGSESWWTLLWCLWRPPSLPGLFPLGFSLFSALKVPHDDRSITDGHHPKNWFSGIPTVQGAVQAAETSKVVASVADAFTSVTVLTTPSVPGDLTAAAEFVLGVFYPFYGSALGPCGPKVRISSVFFSWLLGIAWFFLALELQMVRDRLRAVGWVDVVVDSLVIPLQLRISSVLLDTVMRQFQIVPALLAH